MNRKEKTKRNVVVDEEERPTSPTVADDDDDKDKTAPATSDGDDDDDKDKPKTPVADGDDEDDKDKPKTPVADGDDEDDKDKPKTPVADGDDDDDKDKPKTPVADGDDDDDKDKPAPPPTFGEDDDDDDKTKPTVPVASTETSKFDTSSIFGFVKSLFSSVTAQFSFTNIFNGFSPVQNLIQQPFQNLQQRFFGGWQPQPPQAGFGFGSQGGFAPGFQVSQQNVTSTQYTYSASSSTTRVLDGKSDNEVWLTNETEEVTINATNTTGSNILAGNNKDNQIFGGRGRNDMWGGGGKTNDYLFGGEGHNTFWYGKGEGIDLVENTKSGDTINLYNITLGDISNLEITDSSISIIVGNGEGLSVNTSGEVSPDFKLSNGETYNYNRSSGEWQKA